jgi:hypothetical protein
MKTSIITYMVNKSKLVAVVLATASITGCATGPNAQTDAVIGGLLGAGAGGIIGHQSGRGLEGAAIGALIGGASGNMFGNGIDTRNGYNRQQQYQQPQYQQPVYQQQYQQRPPQYYNNGYGQSNYCRPSGGNVITTTITTRRGYDNNQW